MTLIETEFITLAECPLCETSSDQFALVTEEGDRFSGEKAVLCKNCGLVFLNPRMSDAAITEYYLSNTFSEEVRGSSTPTAEALDYRDMRAQRRWRFLKDVLPTSQKRCLEIGSSSGNFLRILKNHGYDVTGIDPSAGFAEYARSQGMNSLVGNFPDDLPDDTPFDMIFMFHVLEHVVDPLAMLKSIRRYLKDDGRFILEYPDVALASQRFFLSPTYFQKAHLYDFSEETLAVYFARAGFEIEHTFFEEKVNPYDRNVLLVVKASQPHEPEQWSSSHAADLYARLRQKISMYGTLSVFKPVWHFYRKLRGK